MTRMLQDTTSRCFACLFLAGLLVLACLFSMQIGAVKVPASRILSLLCHPEPQSTDWLILFHVRLPRILLGAMVGACLAVSGAILQSIMRNPLASPGIIGVSSGAGLAGILIMLVLPQFSLLFIPVAFCGAMATAAIVYILAWKHGASPVRIILAGVAVSALLGALSNAILLYHAEQAGSVLNFSVGSLATRSWPQIRQVALYMAIGLAGALLLSRQLNVLALGDDLAGGLGLSVEKTRFVLLALAALLAASAVSVAGLLGFVGLMSPHIVRMLLGADNRFVIPASALFGALLVVVCDTLGRIVIAPSELPVGLLMALLGAPFFLWLLRRRANGT